MKVLRWRREEHLRLCTISALHHSTLG